MHSDDPRCGRCGKPRSQHNQSISFCQQEDTVANIGCLFTDVPTSETLVNYMRLTMPHSLSIAEASWKRMAGHS